MKVRDLIALLEKCPKTANVYVVSPADQNDWYMVDVASNRLGAVEVAAGIVLITPVSRGDA